MALVVLGLVVSGKQLNPVYTGAAPEVYRTKFPGLAGEAELYGPPGGRPVEWMIWTYPHFSMGSAIELGNALDSLIGLNGTVVDIRSADEGGSVEWENMTLEGWDQVLIDGRPGPFFSPGGTYYGWWMPIRIRFYQLISAGSLL